MTITLRPFQLEAINKTSEALARGVKRPLIIAPTASGKSWIFAGIIDRAFQKNPNRRILSLCYIQEVLEQNESALNKLNPMIKTGVYCAGAGRKETKPNVIFASRDSLGNDPFACGEFDLILIDEAHMVSMNEETRYQKILSAQNPKWIIGATGTPFRYSGGNIFGPGGFFEEVSYNIGLDFLVKEGYLCPYVFPKPETAIIKTTDVKVSRLTGDFQEKDLERVSSTPEIVARSIDYWQSRASDRKVSLFFCCSIAHAGLVRDEINSRGVAVAYLDGETPQRERETILKGAKEGQYKAIVNVGVLTTGTDIPIIDCVVMLRATKSASLFVQSCGRGLRIFPDKKDLLILDMTDNFERFESLSNPKWISQKSEEPSESTGSGEGPQKECPQCKASVSAASKVCRYCLHVFITHSDKPIEQNRSGWFDVERYVYFPSKTKAGQACFIAVFHLVGRRQPVRVWYVHGSSNDFVRRSAYAALGELRSKHISKVYIPDLHADFPKVKKFSYDHTKEPIKEGGEPVPMPGFLFA